MNKVSIFKTLNKLLSKNYVYELRRKKFGSTNGDLDAVTPPTGRPKNNSGTRQKNIYGTLIEYVIDYDLATLFIVNCIPYGVFLVM